jgi:putative oxygen-independent coproporphyrinogen III oxidase
MPSALPDGAPAPSDGRLPDSALAELAGHSLGAYVHVPFCVTRCGYCDFNTYTAAELGGMSQQTYVDAVSAEVALARDVLGSPPPLHTIFFGGGTPTLLDVEDHLRLMAKLRDTFEMAPDCEVTTEANPESVSLRQLERLRSGGFNRISFGMQSATSHVLATLDRRHSAGRVKAAVSEARAAGFDNVSLDLIYGTPGETVDEWTATLDQALALEPDHVSAYALIVEPGTALARRIARGELPDVVDDDQAEKYEVADRVLTGAGLHWYEVSNWATSDDTRCRHNLAYWRGQTWWGFGPGAHSHAGGVRWWNVKHPAAYASQLASGRSPAAAREILDDRTRSVERVLLEVRLSDGLPTSVLTSAARRAASQLASEGLVEPGALEHGQVVLTRGGRLLADLVVRRLLDS